ncbi:hypothetical protein L9F63_017825 [Diploptera punctata]|uniref:Protein yellow n=1 Tax=Diploptera punctata TaxID=6984 RepID=A0AAD7ZYC6_DIPPU|nr:hypothetical protein L9F63_017825 [Diploptera punctata]
MNFQWIEEGIFGMALSPIKADGFRTLFFSPLASHREFAVSTKILRDKTLAENSYQEFVALDERGHGGHTTATFMDDNGLMFFNLIDQNAVGCWDSSRHPYHQKYHGLVDQDDVGLVFPSDVKVDRHQNLWVVSDRMPVFLVADALDPKDINFRIYSTSVANAVRGTVCEPEYQQYSSHNVFGYDNDPFAITYVK